MLYMDIARSLDLQQLLKKKSIFLFGPRSTGKTYLIRKTIAEHALVIDLLRSDVYLRLASAPSDLEGMIEASGKKSWVVIDEIQRLPELLNEVHRLIEEREIHFLLTGSSARKLRHKGVNLLAGRAWRAELFPLTAHEISNFDLDRYLFYGGLPVVHISQEPEEELSAYVHTYLYEEIQAEGYVRKLPHFARFLQMAALSNSQMLNFATLASDTGIAASTIREYYNILKDTLIGFQLEPWTKTKKRKAIATAKFYFFDLGVTHTLAGTRHLDRNSDLYGRSFEQWVGMELRAYLSYTRSRDTLTYWRSTHGHEVDYVIGDHTAIEAKATRRCSARDLHGLKALKEEGLLKKYILVTQDKIESTQDKMTCLHWRSFVKQLWAGQLF